MPRPLTILRTSNFLGENDDVPVAIEDGQATVLQDWVKNRKKLVRRAGFSLVTTAMDPLDAATSLSATAVSDTAIDLSWTDNSTDEDGYKVERSLDGSTGWAQIGTTIENDTTYSDTGLSAATQYFYRVRPYRGGYNGDYSSTANATTEATATDPLTLTGLELYLRSDQVAGANGAAVSTWPDISGNSRDAGQATGANQPTVLDPGSANGTKLVRFDGSNDFMEKSIGTFPANTNGHTFYFYGDWKATTNGAGCAIIFADQTTQRPQLILDEANPGTQAGFRDQTGTRLGGAYATGTATWVWTFPAGGGTATLHRDGTEIMNFATWNWTAGSAGPKYSLGNGPGGCETKVDLGAVVWFSQTHDAATRAAVIEYLRQFFEE